MVGAGLLFLDDLHAHTPWGSDRAAEWLRAEGRSGPLLAPVATPPPGLVVVAREVTLSQLEASADWLRSVEQLVLVILEPDLDPELEDLRASERAELAARLGRPPVWLEAGADPRPAIQRGLELIQARAQDPWPALAPGLLFAAHPPGPWIRWSPPVWNGRAAEVMDFERHLGGGLCRPGGRPALLDGASGRRLDLGSGDTREVEGLAGAADAWRPLAALPDGERWIRLLTGRPASWQLQGPGERAITFGGGWGRPIGVEASGRFAWGGGRCYFHWWTLDAGGPALWTPSSHDWPCGHAKKLYGHEDNDPLWVQLDPAGRACLSTYEHDNLLTPGLPLRWRDLGGFALAERARGEPRAVLFARSDDPDAYPGDPLQAEEDARDGRVVASLGPSPEQRLVVSLEQPTYLFQREQGRRLGGPNEGWVVLDGALRVVRRAPGCMLAGFERWVLYELEGGLFREDLLDGAREALGPAGRPIAGAVALSGTPNAVLYSLEGFLRLV